MRVYNIEHLNVAVTAAITTLIEFTAQTNRSVIILRAWCSQKTNVTSAQQDIELIRRSTASTNVTAPNANPIDATDTAFGGTVRGMCTVLGTAGAVLYPDSFNWVNGWQVIFQPAEQILVKGGDIVSLHLPTAPAALTLNAGITIAEVG